jgi:hypothetical protein
MPSSIDLDIDSPDKLPIVLETAAQFYRDSASAWTDPSAGKVWEDFARILDRAAESCRKSIRNRLG